LFLVQAQIAEPTTLVKEIEAHQCGMDAIVIASHLRDGPGFLAGIHKGTALILEQSRLGQKLWTSAVSEIHLAARESLVKGVRQNIHVRDPAFRRFDTGVQQQIAPSPQQQVEGSPYAAIGVASDICPFSHDPAFQPSRQQRSAL
jgi:hypothetical protein